MIGIHAIDDRLRLNLASSIVFGSIWQLRYFFAQIPDETSQLGFRTYITSIIGIKLQVKGEGNLPKLCEVAQIFNNPYSNIYVTVQAFIKYSIGQSIMWLFCPDLMVD